ncbi:MAG: glutamate-5-semialdehyde dehydrogenase [Tannerella sp.]|jgi:glutamate-5-semialdehyde dehydrogenase|nr:glutamate-5-semialdehyde dehydrogenase [Tannerella sp.]
MKSNILIKEAASAVSALINISEAKINEILNDTAEALLRAKNAVLVANQEDLSQMEESNPKYDRLKLTSERIDGIANDMRQVTLLPSPLNKILNETVHPNGMRIRKVSVPFGVIGIVYEARPNVTFDVFSLCIKSGNVCLLKGGSDADNSNRALVTIIHDVLKQHGVDPSVCTLLPPGHDATTALLHAVGSVDLVIPRGSSSLINYVRENARVPVIETGAGICHTYFDRDGDKEKGREIINNAKTRRVSVCNALDCLIVHRDRLDDLPYICAKLPDSDVLIYADDLSMAALSGHYPSSLLMPSTSESYGTEFLDYKMSIKTVNSREEALIHIACNSSKHSECIISESEEAIQDFMQRVDAACVYVNVSTAFTDGAQFGFGAEIGISTQKMHARGPMALQELTTYKYLITGNGQIRS